jgi:hypothetical protein
MLARIHNSKVGLEYTFRLRQLLQFIASRGSFETRRAGRRSIPICGLDIAAAIDCETSVDIGALVMKRQDASSSKRQPLEHEQDVRKKQSTGNARREMYVQIKASGSGDGQGTHGRQGLMSSCGSARPLRNDSVWCIAKDFLRRGQLKDWNTRPRDDDLGLSACGASNRWAEYKPQLQRYIDAPRVGARGTERVAKHDYHEATTAGVRG